MSGKSGRPHNGQATEWPICWSYGYSATGQPPLGKRVLSIGLRASLTVGLVASCSVEPEPVVTRFAVMAIAFLLMPVARLRSPIHAVPYGFGGLAVAARALWAGFSSVFTRRYWCLLLVPLQQLGSSSGWMELTNLGHLLGMLCGVAIVLMLPARITMPGRETRLGVA